LLIGELNVRMIGIPTPYVFRYPWKILVENVREGVSVRNVLRSVTVRPVSSAAVARTV